MWGNQRIRLTELELKHEALVAKFRSLSTEWTETLAKYDSILKRVNRFFSLENGGGRRANLQNPADMQVQELTPENIMEEYYRGKGGR